MHQTISVSKTSPLNMTFEEFLEWSDEDTHAEWVEGQVILQMPASQRHQLLVGFLYNLISLFLQRHPVGKVLLAPFLMRLASRPSGREPDVLFISDTNLGRLRENMLEGPADLVIEVVSPESTVRDYEEKKTEYQQAGIPEYWLIDPIEQVASFFQLDANGIYQPVALDRDGRYLSRTLSGFRLNPTWLWQDPHPLLDALREMRLMP